MNEQFDNASRRQVAQRVDATKRTTVVSAGRVAGRPTGIGTASKSFRASMAGRRTYNEASSKGTRPVLALTTASSAASFSSGAVGILAELRRCPMANAASNSNRSRPSRTEAPKPPRMKQQDLNENRQMDCRRGRCALGRVGILSMLQRTEPQTMVPPQASSLQGTLITCRRHRSPSAIAARQVHSRPCLRECLWTYTKPRNVRTSAG